MDLLNCTCIHHTTLSSIFIPNLSKQKQICSKLASHQFVGGASKEKSCLRLLLIRRIPQNIQAAHCTKSKTPSSDVVIVLYLLRRLWSLYWNWAECLFMCLIALILWWKSQVISTLSRSTLCVL